MKANIPTALCAALALAGCASGVHSGSTTDNAAPVAASPKAAATIPDPKASVLPPAIQQVLGVWYAGTANLMDHRYSARMVNKIEQLPDGKLRVRECSTDKGHYYATTPEPGMRCVTARDPTVDGNSIHATGTGGGRVTLTFGTSPAEYQLKTEYRNLILVATMYREKP